MLRSKFRALVPRCCGRPVRGVRRRARRHRHHRSSGPRRRIQYRCGADIRAHSRVRSRPGNRQHYHPRAVSRRPSPRVAPVSRDRRSDRARQAHRGGGAARERRGVPVELAIVRVPNSEPPLFTAFLRDLTEPRRLEQRRAAVYNVAAELRTPLNALLGWATALKRGALSEEKQRRAVEAIEHGARTQVHRIWRAQPESLITAWAPWSNRSSPHPAASSDTCCR